MASYAIGLTLVDQQSIQSFHDVITEFDCTVSLLPNKMHANIIYIYDFSISTPTCCSALAPFSGGHSHFCLKNSNATWYIIWIQ
jgi:hypothetical protein